MATIIRSFVVPLHLYFKDWSERTDRDTYIRDTYTLYYFPLLLLLLYYYPIFTINIYYYPWAFIIALASLAIWPRLDNANTYVKLKFILEQTSFEGEAIAPLINLTTPLF